MRIKVDGLELEIPPAVYEPSDDSLLLLKYSKTLKGRVLDVGCGCGIQALANARENPDNFVLGVDINPVAVQAARYNAAINGIKNAFFSQSDIFESIPESRFDGIIFNPPYLPTKAEEKIGGPLNHAFDGGEDGRAVIDVFLYDVEKHLTDEGVLLLLHSELNDVGKTTAALKKKGFSVLVKDSVPFFFEMLYVLEARR